MPQSIFWLCSIALISSFSTLTTLNAWNQASKASPPNSTISRPPLARPWVFDLGRQSEWHSLIMTLPVILNWPLIKSSVTCRHIFANLPKMTLRPPTSLQCLRVIWGQCCPRVTAGPWLPNGPITQPSPYLNQNPCRWQRVTVMPHKGSVWQL